jgi:hypothetical protein
MTKTTFTTGAAIHQELGRRVSSLILNYRDDFEVHDRETIADIAPSPFLHWAHRDGTQLAALFPADCERWPAPGVEVKYLFGVADRWHILKQIEEMADYLADPARGHADDPRHATYFDGHRFRDVCLTEAASIAAGHVKTVSAAWRKRN